MIERIEKLRPGSRWQKSLSKKVYEVINLAVDTTTNGAVVIYKPEDDVKWCVRPLGEFLGDVLAEATPTGRTYVPRFVPVEK